ncbi:MAG TPA: hypothetical protein VFB12_27925 [Ktedonobacteraceae bacterium]|nr:hypothetical protein [Ktedonobacteraceae bacterium]
MELIEKVYLENGLDDNPFIHQFLRNIVDTRVHNSGILVDKGGQLQGLFASFHQAISFLNDAFFDIAER